MKNHLRQFEKEKKQLYKQNKMFRKNKIQKKKSFRIKMSKSLTGPFYKLRLHPIHRYSPKQIQFLLSVLFN